MGFGAGKLGLVIAPREFHLLPRPDPRLYRLSHPCRLARVLACRAMLLGPRVIFGLDRCEEGL